MKNAILKFQPPSNKNKIIEILGMLNFLSKHVYKMQSYLRPFLTYYFDRMTSIGPWNIKKVLMESEHY